MSYVELNIELLLICAILIAVVFIANLKNWRGHFFNSLSFMHILAFLCCFFEAAAFLANDRPELLLLNYVSNILYLGSLGVIGLCTFFYCNTQFPVPLCKTRLSKFLFSVPFVIEIIALLSAPKTGLVFFVDEMGHYHRSATFFLQCIPYAYILLTTFVSLKYCIRAETRIEKNKFAANIIFSLAPILLGSIQLFVAPNLLDIMMFSIAISLLIHLLVTQNNLITRDPMTTLPNRAFFELTLHEKMNRKSNTGKLYLFLFDIDDFKSINDTYGHLEGDNAIKRCACVLKEVCALFKATPARFGGDEFAVFFDTTSEEADLFTQKINDVLAEKSIGEKYVLRLSVGFAPYRNSDSVPDLVKAADKALYKEKTNHKTANRNAGTDVSSQQ